MAWLPGGPNACDHKVLSPLTCMFIWGGGRTFYILKLNIIWLDLTETVRFDSGWQFWGWVIPSKRMPIGSMYGIFTYIWLIFMLIAGKYTSSMDPMGWGSPMQPPMR